RTLEAGPSRLWLAGREFVADAHGEIVVPLTAGHQHQTGLLVAGELATVVEVPLYGESIELLAPMVIAREHLGAGSRVRAIADVALRIAGVPASLQLLRNVRWEVTLRAVDGTVTTKAEPLLLSDSAAAVLEWKLPEDITSIEVAIAATCTRQTDGGTETLRTSTVIALPAPPIDAAPASDPIAELFLMRHAQGAALCCLGRNGEPVVGRPVVLRIQHRFSSTLLMVTLQTDQRGEVQLGALDDVVSLSASVGEVTQQWSVAQPQLALTSRAGRADRPLVIPVQHGSFDEYAFATQLAFATLVEVRGAVVVRHITAAPVWHEGAIRLPLLAAGDYRFTMPGLGRVELLVLPEATLSYGNHLCATDVVVVQPLLPPRVTVVELANQRLRVRLVGVDAATTVHLLATQFAMALTDETTRRIAGLSTTQTTQPQAQVINGRDLGDEVRYVFDRKHAVRRPGPLLDKPSLLLHPWARQATVTNTMTASFGAAMSAPAPAPSMRSMRKMAKEAPEPPAQALSNYSFVASNGSVVANVPLQRDADSDESRAWFDIDLALVVGASLRIVICDSRGRVAHDVYRPTQTLQTRDVRLQLAIAPERHVAERRKIDILQPGQPLVVRDLATAKLRAVETVDKLYGYLVALSDTSVATGLGEFSFVTSWHTLTTAAKLDLYQRFACHELHLFVFFKDVGFFESVVAPALANKRRKTFVDEWLLQLPLQTYLAPGRFAQLNACERALLAYRVSNQRGIARVLTDDIHAQGRDRSEPRRVAAMLLGAAMDDDAALAGLQRAAHDSQLAAVGGMMLSEIQADYDDSSDDEMLSESKDEYAPESPKAKRASASRGGGGPGGPPQMDRDRERREQAPAIFQVLDKTQEWAESNWWHKRPNESAGLIVANSFWQALATCAPEQLRSFLHADVGLCVDSFAAALCALALSDLPFSTTALGYAESQGDVAVTSVAPALLASAQLLTSELVAPAKIVLVQNYLQANQRSVWRDGESHELYVEGDLMVGVPYVVQAVVSNASAQPVRGEVLMQVPRGAITLGAGGATMRHPLDLAPYTTTTFESVFYFPAAGAWSHFPAHATAGGEVLGAALPRVLQVVPYAAQFNADNWDDVANRVALPALLEYLRTRALGPSQDLDALAWRLRERAAYDAILAALEERCRFDDVLWGYALLHGDAPRGLQLLQHRRFVDATEPDVGPAFAEAELMDDEDLAVYEHLE
ncbi:MAG: hypothetical protein KBG15_03685, partial [Kofleriaceae bacterium]|nr:hypothetical protein [Kofleriaceae bacterium]